MKIEFSYSNRTAQLGEPWDLRLGDERHTAEKVIFENVDALTEYHAGASEGRFGWLVTHGEVTWNGKTATIKGQS